ncbi:autotransporter-associated N-terminal domain-containing protein [Leptotrichia sp. oral taxon 847]|uniref:autotransporter-associated N-terminal domain-containing protein n=1 Tax=Leptotrichia sp. oral taxon 847 TaxID=1785996 RepID=UPI00076805D3|nr:autotransporter-associated N-terminal domain-containing protein [Leptotrichia sp. oral taxon 847]AMD95275.1 hypothetical protein AXF11_06630 [Leptotrichia sp. oral taxon 847]
MGSNNLKQLKKDLKAFAKRVKDFKYTESALIAFLLTGMVMLGVSNLTFSAQDEITAQTKQINSSISDIRQQFKRARAENNKLLRDTNLELIQLMEQGDQVVKSPWSSWQYGINYFYNDWHGHYRGRGDKIDSFVYKRDDSIVNRSVYPGKIETKYGATTLGLVREPNAAMDVSAALTPKSVDKVAPRFTVQGAGGGFPNFATRVVKAPEAPSAPISPSITVNQAPVITFQAQGFGQGRDAELHGDQGIHLMNFSNYTATGIANFNVTNNTSTLTSGSITYDPLNLGALSMSPGVSATPHSAIPAGTISATDTMTIASNPYNPDGIMNAVFSHVVPMNVTMTGNYSLNSTADHNILFISVNPYDYYETAGDKTFKFNGNVTLNSNGGSSVVGIEHQLLNGNGGGGANPVNQVVSSVENNGNITLGSGSYMIGMMIDTEYYGVSSHNKFNKNPKTDNNGKIIISGDAKNSIGIDYGFYALDSTKKGPNSSVRIGDIIIDGKKSYGYRQKDYTNSVAPAGTPSSKGDIYYDEMSTVDGGNGSIILNGEENIGMAIFQGKTTGDPIDNFKNINIKVGGSKNIGFLRGTPDNGYSNGNDITLDGTKLSAIGFGGSYTDASGTKQDITVGDDNALIRSEKIRLN